MTNLTIIDNDVHIKSHAIPSYVAYVDLDVTSKDFLDPKFWVHTLRNFKTDDGKKMLGAEIIIYKRDYSYRAELIVTDVNDKGLIVKMIAEHDLTSVQASPPSEDAEYKKVFVPAHKAYNIVRIADKTVIASKLSKDAVEAKLAELNG